jgi:LacI family transcriptional regulator
MALENGRTRATINDVARVARVSKKTVSRVINNSPFVREETREKVAAVIAQYGYAPDPQARGLAFRRSFLIGLIYDNPSPQYVIDMQQGILNAVRGSGYELVVHPCDRRAPDFLRDVRNFVERQKLFGVVLPPSVSEDGRVAELLREIGCPYVRVASVVFEGPDSQVHTHDHLGAAEAARYLADLGHRRIAFISGPDTFRSSHQRGLGFAEGLAERGLTLEPAYVRQGAYTYDSGVRIGAELLGLESPPTAIFAGNDEMAAGVYTAARGAGLDIPGDLSIVSYDDSPLAQRLWPPLTTVRLPIQEVGRMAAEKLLERAKEEAERRFEVTEVVPRLVVRQSATPPAKV